MTPLNITIVLVNPRHKKPHSFSLTSHVSFGYNLGQIKMEEKCPLPHKSRMKPCAIFPSSILGEVVVILFSMIVNYCKAIMHAQVC